MTKSALIVAAERGLGLGLAEQFFKRGWRVVGTARLDAHVTDLLSIGAGNPDRLAVARIDVTKANSINPFLKSLSDRGFDVIYLNAGIFGPIYLARHLINSLVTPDGTLAFMSSHRGSVEINVEAGLELYQASKVSLNMLAHGIYADYKEQGLTVLWIHPGWARTAMGTLDGAVEPEIELETSVQGVADVVERHTAAGENLYLDYEDSKLPW